MTRTAVVTGASSGIGAAAAHTLSGLGFDVVLGARRADRLAAVAAAVPGPGTARALPLDVTSTASVQEFAAGIGSCDLLVNNAGGALGLAPVEEADDEQWRWMFEANVLGTVRVTRALLPALLRADAGQIVNIGSVAGVETYEGGGGYTAAKHALKAVSETLRLELAGRGVRVTEIAPGMVETEFSVVRLGSQEAADKVYAGVTPLVAADIAEIVGFVASRPAHVCLDYVAVKPVAQATATRVFRRP